ncbi:MAG: alanine--glyoxylate aminotransferase family protein [Spirochaetales bacterium]|jgi:alanine-glyoxylate transaminase / serine-glyoxylate transaminase / serine-pyruvate transaminase|nr:alanine--glyoxylate aminotransferase family protein [Spirochaetales bacterium]
MIDTQKRYTLLIPGPTECPDYVLNEMSMQVLPHYESEWGEIYWEINSDLQKVLGTNSDIFPINGSGTFSFELCMASLLQEGDKVLAIANSAWGEGIGQAAERFGAEVIYAQHEWYEPVHPEQLIPYFEDNNFALVVAVHHDTGSGFLNPLDEIGDVCRRFDVPFLVDAVSSVGGVPFKMDEWGVDFCCTSVQKCLDCPPGIAIVGVSNKAWKHIEKVKNIQRGRYMDLRYWRQNAIDQHDTHPNMVTSATNNLMALKASLKHILAEGLSEREAKYRKFGTFFRKGLENMGLRTKVRDEYSPLLTYVVLPDGIDSKEPRDFLRFKYNILTGVEFRFAHFGSQVSYNYLTLGLVGIEDFLRQKGIKMPSENILEGLEELRS